MVTDDSAKPCISFFLSPVSLCALLPLSSAFLSTFYSFLFSILALLFSVILSISQLLYSRPLVHVDLWRYLSVNVSVCVVCMCLCE